MDTLYGDVIAAEDKLAATLYCIKSNESLYAENILGENAYVFTDFKVKMIYRILMLKTLSLLS